MLVFLKDNIGIKEFFISVGIVVLKDWVIGEDVIIVENLKVNGVLIFGKINMFEWVVGMDEEFLNGYLGKKG